MEDDDHYVDISLDGSDVEVNSAESAVSASTYQVNTEDVPIKVPIVSYENLESRSRITIFRLHVGARFFVHRSFADFCRLSEKLTKTFPGLRLPLPPKRWIGQFEHSFLEKRREGLQNFLDTILGHMEIADSAIVKEFLCLDCMADGGGSEVEQRFAIEEDLDYCRHVIYEKEEYIQELLRENELLQDQKASLLEASKLERQYFREKVNGLQRKLELGGNRGCLSLPFDLERTDEKPPSCSRCNPSRRTCSLLNLSTSP